MNFEFKLGMRTFKTLLAVALCIISLSWFNVDSPFFACIATIFVIQGDKDHSIANAKNRVWGTAIGASIANLLLVVVSFLPYNAYTQAFATCASIFILIQIASHFKKPFAIFPGCIVLCAILCTTTNIQMPILYGIKRTIHTIYGALIGLGVNLYIYPYDPAQEPSNEPVEIAEIAKQTT